MSYKEFLAPNRAKSTADKSENRHFISTMGDFLDLLPDDLFICVIFPQLHLLEVIAFKQVAKRYQKLATEYQTEYNKPINTTYDKLQIFEDNLPNGVCCINMYISDKVTSIKSYRVMKYLTITFNTKDNVILNDTYYSEYYTFNESNVDYFDLSNLCGLKGLIMYCIPTTHKIYNLSVLTNLIKLELHNTEADLDLSSRTNLSLLHIVDCPNITSFPKDITLSTLSLIHI